MGLQGEFMKESVTTLFADIGKLRIGMLLLNMMTKSGRVSTRVCSSRLGLEITEMTHQMAICIALIRYLLLWIRCVKHLSLLPPPQLPCSIFVRVVSLKYLKTLETEC